MCVCIITEKWASSMAEPLSACLYVQWATDWTSTYRLNRSKGTYISTNRWITKTLRYVWDVYISTIGISIDCQKTNTYKYLSKYSHVKIYIIPYHEKAFIDVPWVASDRSDFIPRQIDMEGRARIKAESLLGSTGIPTSYQRDKSLVSLAVELGRERAARLIRPEANGSKKDDH